MLINMKKYIQFLVNNLFKIDKLYHILAGLVIYLGAWLLLGVADYLALLLVAIFGIGKEVRDAITGKGTPEVLDTYMTVLPALIIYVIFVKS